MVRDLRLALLASAAGSWRCAGPAARGQCGHTGVDAGAGHARLLTTHGAAGTVVLPLTN